MIDINQLSSKNINELTHIYVKNPSLSAEKILEILQERLQKRIAYKSFNDAIKSANESIQKILQEHQSRINESSSKKQQNLNQFFEEAESLLAYPRAINDPNPSDLLLIKTHHEESKFARAQVEIYQDSISRVKRVELSFKSALRESFRLLGNEPNNEMVEKLLNEIEIKQRLKELEEEEKKWQQEVNKLKRELASFPIVTLYGQSNLENFQNNNHNNGDTNDVD